MALAAVSSMVGAGVSEEGAPIQRTTVPFWYVWTVGNFNVLPGVSGKSAEISNSPFWPVRILPPVHVITRVPKLTFQPRAGAGFTFARPRGSRTATLVVRAGSSPATVSVNVEELAAGTFFGVILA